jgi:FkbM family methyltransferase
VPTISTILTPKLQIQFLAARGHQVHAFEPFIKNSRLLRCSAVFNRFANIHTYRVALSNDTTATAKCLQAPDGNMGGTTITENCDQQLTAEQEKYRKSTDIRTVTMDNFWTKVMGRRRFDMIKIDIEGYEVKAWEGAKEMLQNAPPYIVFSEVFPAKIRDAGREPQDYVNIMRNAGYRLFKLHTLQETPVDYERKWEDVIFVHKSLASKLIPALGLIPNQI